MEFFPQRLAMQTTIPRLQDSDHIRLLELPVEIVCKCLSWLPLSALMRWMACSTNARDVAVEDVTLWRQINFYGAQGMDKSEFGRIKIDLEKVSDDTVSGLLLKLSSEMRRLIHTINLDYTAVTLRLVDMILFESDLLGLKVLNLNGCRNVVFPSEREFRVLLGQICLPDQSLVLTPLKCKLSRFGLLGTTIYTPLPHVQSHLTPCTLDFLQYSWAAVMESDSHRWEQAHVIANDGHTADLRGRGMVPDLPSILAVPRCLACQHHLVRIYNMDSINVKDVPPAQNTGSSVSMMDPVRTHVYKYFLPCPICHKREHLCQSYSCSIHRPICVQCHERGPCLECQGIKLQKPASSQDLSKRRHFKDVRQRLTSDEIKPLFRVVPPSQTTLTCVQLDHASTAETQGHEVFKYHYDFTSPKMSPITRFSPWDPLADAQEYYCSPLCRKKASK
jgi:hypothetical protein